MFVVLFFFYVNKTQFVETFLYFFSFLFLLAPFRRHAARHQKFFHSKILIFSTTKNQPTPNSYNHPTRNHFQESETNKNLIRIWEKRTLSKKAVFCCLLFVVVCAPAPPTRWISFGPAKVFFLLLPLSSSSPLSIFLLVWCLFFIFIFIFFYFFFYFFFFLVTFRNLVHTSNNLQKLRQHLL